ncbi:MAG TPA: plastocyanin/azurin family copper-binding protein, partial [Actinomycetota bacterium]|nr:plastocyanin/azurin family copper-binding protein [Actinomycetota bacterium]
PRAVFVLAAGLAFALSAQTAALAATVDVTVADFAFSPKGVKVPQGTVVRWTNDGPHSHTSTSDSTNPDGSKGIALWNSGVIVVGGYPYSRTFTAAGGFPYHCNIHPTMNGSVTVPVKGPKGGVVGQSFTVGGACSRRRSR